MVRSRTALPQAIPASWKTLAVSLLLGWGFPAWAAPAASIPEKPFTSLAVPPVRVYSEKDGLPQSLVEDLAVDPRGYLWAATQGGPARYDGHRWTAIQDSETRSLGWVQALAFEPEGGGWFATMLDGIWRWDGKLLTKDTAPGLPNALPRRLVVAHGQVWLALNSGVYLRRKDSWEPVPGLQWDSIQVQDLLVAGVPGKPELWIATNQGLVQWRDGHTTTHRSTPGLPSDNVTALAQEVGGPAAPIWVGTQQGLCRLEGGLFLSAPHQNRLPSPSIRRLRASRTADGDLRLLIGTERGVVRWQGPNWKRFASSDLGLPTMVVSALCLTSALDAEDTLWIGSHAGLYHLPPSPWLKFPPLPGLADQNTWAILETRNPSTFWVGGSGLGRWQSGRWTALGPKEGLPDDTVYALAATDQDRILWVGTRGHGLLWKPGARLEPVPGFPDTQCYNLRTSINPATPDVLWASHRHGISRWSKGTWRHFGPKEGLPTGFVTGLAESLGTDGQSTLWASVRLKGVGRLRPGASRWEWLSPEASHPGPTSLNVIQEPAGAYLWMGTLGQGILRLPCEGPLRTEGWVDGAQLGGAPVAFTYAVAQDRLGAVYAYTSRGVSRLNPKPGGGFAVQTFTSDDGLPGDRCQHQTPLVDSQGRIWVATTRGIAVLDPALVKVDQNPKPLLLQSITIGDRSLSPAQLADSPLHITWRDQRVDVRFTQISFHRGDETQYRTQLWDLEPQPTAWTRQAGREILRLPGGSFEMRIWAVDYAGNLSHPLRIPILVEAPPWSRWWAFALYGLTLWGLFLLGLRWRVQWLKLQNDRLSSQVATATTEIEQKSLDLERALRHMENLNQEKNRVLGVAAHDLRNPLSTIGLYAELIEAETPDREVRTMASKIQIVTKELGHFVGHMLDSSRIEAGSLDLNLVEVDLAEVLASVREAHEPRAKAKGIELRLAISTAPSRALADPFHVREILDNLVTNAIKFMQPGPPVRTITLRAEGEWLHVEDQGPGFTLEDQAHLFGRFSRLSARPTSGEGSTGLGLSIVKELVEAMDGEIRLTSLPGEGSTFSVHLPPVPPPADRPASAPLA